MKITSSLIFLLITSGMLHGQAQTNLFQNGSFHGTVGEDHHGEGWSTGSTPDLNDTSGVLYTSTGYVWTKKPLPSDDGGTWQNLYSYRESLEQKVTVEKGETYTIIFEYASQLIHAGEFAFEGPVGINIHIDEELKFSATPDKTPYTW